LRDRPRLQITHQDFVKTGAVEGFSPQNTVAFGEQRQKTTFTIQTGGIKSPGYNCTSMKPNSRLRETGDPHTRG
jgi:hypothetical protein